MDALEQSTRWQLPERSIVAEGKVPVAAPIQFSIWSILNLTVLFAMIFALARHDQFLAMSWFVLCIPAGVRTFSYVRIQHSLGFSVGKFGYAVHFIGSLGWMMLVVYFTVLTTVLAAVLSALLMLFFTYDVSSFVVLICCSITALISAVWMTYTTWPGRGDCH